MLLECVREQINDTQTINDRKLNVKVLCSVLEQQTYSCWVVPGRHDKRLTLCWFNTKSLVLRSFQIHMPTSRTETKWFVRIDVLFVFACFRFLIDGK